MTVEIIVLPTVYRSGLNIDLGMDGRRTEKVLRFCHSLSKKFTAMALLVQGSEILTEMYAKHIIAKNWNEYLRLSEGWPTEVVIEGYAMAIRHTTKHITRYSPVKKAFNRVVASFATKKPTAEHVRKILGIKG